MQNAACWIGVTADGQYAYTGNAGSGTVTGFAVGAGGTLTRLTGAGGTVTTGGGVTSTVRDVSASCPSGMTACTVT